MTLKFSGLLAVKYILMQNVIELSAAVHELS